MHPPQPRSRDRSIEEPWLQLTEWTQAFRAMPWRKFAMATDARPQGVRTSQQGSLRVSISCWATSRSLVFVSCE